MRIGVDATCWGNKRGFGRFTRELLGALLELDKTNEYLFFIDTETADVDTIPSNASVLRAQTSVSAMVAASAESRRSLKDVWAMTYQVSRHKLDIFFFPAVYSYFPIINRTKVVVTLHDVIADHHPELIFPNARSKFFWKAKQYAAIRQADVIATVSEYSKREIIDYFKLHESDLRIISEAARPVFRVLNSNGRMSTELERHRLKPDEKFLLYVGGISPHKNLAALIDAFAQIANSQEQRNLQLFLVGDYKDDPFFSAYPGLKKQVDGLGMQDHVIFTGFIPDEELAHLYNAATLVVLPSFEEGFGLPAIEAMACGTPVAASNCGSLPEVLGEAGRFFDPHDTNDIAKVIRQTMADQSALDLMREKGLARSSKFMWRKAAEDTLAIFDELYAR